MRHRLPDRLVSLAASFAVDADRLYRGFEIPIQQSGRQNSMAWGGGLQGKFPEIPGLEHN
jgi:hypothetical protein